MSERTPGTDVQHDLRDRVASMLLERTEIVAGDAAGVFPFSGDDEPLDREYCVRITAAVVRLLAEGVRDGRVDAHGAAVAELHRLVLERRLRVPRLFALAYLTERSALDELAVDQEVGAQTEPWGAVAQFVRRASFDALAAYADRAQSSDAAIVDPLTTVHTRAMFDAVLTKEAERAGRYGYPLALILFDVDNLAGINAEHGHRVGDRVLERLGILIRQYFRQHDWVARHGEDSMAVLLTRADVDYAETLAERLRTTVAERLGSTDHRTDRPVAVTVSSAVVTVRPAAGDVVDPERLLADAETALARAAAERHAGGPA